MTVNHRNLAWTNLQDPAYDDEPSASLIDAEDQAKSPDVSIIIPTHNRAHIIVTAIQSCLVQRGVSLEILVIDDGSTDRTRDVVQNEIRAVRGQRVRYVYQKRSGACAARNCGLNIAIGRYVKFLDSDDELILGALAAEVAYADRVATDVIVTGWLERHYHATGLCTTTEVPAPDLSDGIDAMLAGRAPCTSAALYRRNSIRHLRWEVNCHKAQDWLWAWEVCLSDATFSQLNITSSIYHHRPSVDRITAQRNAAWESTKSRQSILQHVESQLRIKNRITEARAQALAQYYFKDAIPICERSVTKWKGIWDHCKALCPGFRPTISHDRVRVLSGIFGPYFAIVVYVMLKHCLRPFLRNRY